MFLQKNKRFIVSLILTFLVLSFIYYGFIHYNADLEFVKLIKEMAIKNHNNPSLFLEKYSEAVTEEEKLKTILTNNFYECIYMNDTNIKTKLDVNLYCGHFIKF